MFARIFNEGKGEKVKPLEVELEQFLLALAACSVFWDIRLYESSEGHMLSRAFYLHNT